MQTAGQPAWRAAPAVLAQPRPVVEHVLLHAETLRLLSLQEQK